ncbi:Beta-apo-4'-carotenal oxygenase [Metarhizium brunneum]|uniref:Aldehyde dehydrogenase n=1 Tax=Metarhizium brunneum TaxID=500148 RepID=A0A7D5UY06_9HYPO
MSYSSEAQVDEAFNAVSNTFKSNATKPLEWRIRQLRKTWWMLEDNRERIVTALNQDLNKHRQETLPVDVAGIQNACLEALANIKEWTKDEKPRRTDPFNLLGGARIRKEPKGVTLIISAWNYPFMELFEPMLSAIAAGCTTILKPSELAPASERLIAEIVPKYLDQGAIRVVTAGPKQMNYLLERKWDHIFFTGSTAVGKIIYAKAAPNLTTVTLELGGRGPAIVTPSADIDLAAKRIANAKFMNAGQICVGVNHVFVDPSVKQKFIAALSKYFDEYRSGQSRQPAYATRIVNERHYKRLDNLLEKTQGKIVYGGDRNPETRFFAPTIVDGVSTDDSLLSEELFGPILPILDATLEQAINYTVQHDHPLALYGFTSSQADKDKILRLTNSGGVCFNDAILHMLVKDAPFGGVGASGMGAYHGPFGFKEFTHLRTVVNVPAWMELLLKVRYAPYTDKKAAAMVRSTGAKTSVPFDRNGNDVTSLAGLLTKSAIAVLFFALLKWKGWSVTDLIASVKGK